MAKLYAPDGTEITGTYEKVFGEALIANFDVTRNADGTFDFAYAGGTEINWNSQVTVTRQGQRVFVDEDGGEWLENELVLREDEDA